MLHNICISNNIPPIEYGDEEEDRHIQIDYGMYDHEPNEWQNQPERNEDLLAGRRPQQMILRNHFL